MAEDPASQSCRLEVTRRRFIEFLVGGGSAAVFSAGLPLVLGGCSCQEQPKVPEGEAPELKKTADLYDGWRELRRRLRQSPDHPLGRAEALVAQGDPSAILGFVRDEVRLMSGEPARFALGDKRVHGKRAALRAGCGTAMEKAEILADLLRDTGRETEVVLTPTIAREEVEGVFFRDFHQPFAPPLDRDEVAAWRSNMGRSPGWEAGLGSFEADEREAAELTEKLLGLIEQGGQRERYGRRSYRDAPVGYTPIVKVTEPDGTRYIADPIRPTGRYEPLPENLWSRKPGSTQPAEGEALTVTVEASRSVSPDDYAELVTGRWTLPEVCGHQVRVSFMPTVDFSTRMVSRVDDLRTFIPSLSVQCPTGGLSEQTQAVVAGEAFTLGGERLTVEANGDIRCDGTLLLKGGPAVDADRVVRLEGELDSSRFPALQLKLSPLDGSDQIVEGLAADQIALKEQGRVVGGSLLSTQAAPRVLFLADASLSMPAEFQGGRPAMQALVDRVTRFAREGHPEAVVRYEETDSNLWEQLVKASMEPVSLIVYATDGDLDGRKPDEKMRETLAQGPPVLVLDVKGRLERYRASLRSNIFDEMAEATGGEAFSVIDRDVASAEEAIKRVMRERASLHPYTIRCSASSLEAGARSLKVRVGQAELAVPYTASGGGERELPTQLASLRLRFQLGRTTVVKHLAGWDGQGAVTQSQIDEVQGAFLGTHVLGIEGPPPPLSVLLDEMTQAKLSLEELDRALGSDAPMEDLVEMMQRGPLCLPGELVSLLGATVADSGSDYSVAVMGCRCVLYSVYPHLDTDIVRKKINIIPLERAHVIARERQTVIKRAFERSVPLAIAESKLMPVSTWSLLKGKPLVFSDRRTFSGDPALDAGLRDRWAYQMERLRLHHPASAFFAAEDGQTLAMWGVQWETGEVLGVLPDGSGGGSQEERIKATLAKLDQAVAMLNLLTLAAQGAGLVSGIGGFSLNIVGAYGQRLARLYAAAAMSVVLMDARGIEPAVRLAIAGMACEITKNLTLAAIGGGGAVFRGAGSVAAKAVNTFQVVDNTIGALGVESPFSCPL